MKRKRKWRHISHPRPSVKTVRGKQRQMEKVEIQMLQSHIDKTLSRISFVALFVKVMARMLYGEICLSKMR